MNNTPPMIPPVNVEHFKAEKTHSAVPTHPHDLMYATRAMSVPAINPATKCTLGFFRFISISGMVGFVTFSGDSPEVNNEENDGPKTY